MRKFLSLVALVVALSSSLWAKNLSIGSSSVVAQNMVNQSVNIQFDVSWDNSWRTSAEPNNWDAVWLFVKYKKANDGKWYHATLNANDASHFTGSQGAGAIIDARADGKGAFYYRSADGTGTFASNQVKLSWNYGTDGIGNNLSTELTELQVFGIEMCYIPQGAFYVGSGGTENNHFYTFGGNEPYQITSEAQISLGSSDGSLTWTSGNYSGTPDAPIPDAFPKGYSAFYCMKYEITQEQYCDFLNTLTRPQQATRTYTNLASGVTSVTNMYVMTNPDDEQYRNGIRCDATIPATTPITFYCDFNGNGVPNESSDGHNIACNWLSWADGIAYSDWSGLRPMTELEFEKVCRGSAPAVANEYAWGSTIITSAGTSIANIINPGEITEASNVSGANCNYWNSNSVGGPLRVGCFSGGSRQLSGASYYGVMEMSGNLCDRCITIGNSEGRVFTGSVGDGLLDTSGDANIATCPGISATGSGFRSGSWNGNMIYARTSDRWGAAYTYSERYDDSGFRCVSGI